MKKIYAILLAVCALGIFAAGCGSKPDDSAKTPDAGAKTPDAPKSGS
jgi:hypothetical protein